MNERGEVMYDICEEGAEPAPKPSEYTGGRTVKEDSSGARKPGQISAAQLALLDDLEAQEPFDPEPHPDPNDPFSEAAFAAQAKEEAADKERKATAESNPSERRKAEAARVEKEKAQAQSWGNLGLLGLKGAFGGSSKGKRSDKVVGEGFPLPAKCDSTEPPAMVVDSVPDQSSSAGQASSPDKGKGRLKARKSVSFAARPAVIPSPPGSDTDMAFDEDEASESETKPTKQPERRTVILPDIVERDADTQPEAGPSSQPGNAHGRNVQIDPRLAALLPKSLAGPSSAVQDEETEDVDDDIDIDASDDSGSLYEYSDEDEAELGYPMPEGEGIQTAMDLKQASMAYHALRPSLGAGAGTGPLGGDAPAVDEEDEDEWVPLDTRTKGEGVPREPSMESKFRGLAKGVRKGAGLEPGQPNVSNGKLFGRMPLVDGQGVKQPKTQSGGQDSDDELTPHEMALLAARIDALAMTPEERETAEKVGGELWELMQKVQRGEMTIEEEQGETGEEPQEAVEKGVDGVGIPPLKAASKKRQEVALGAVQERSTVQNPLATTDATMADVAPPPTKMRKLSQCVLLSPLCAGLSDVIGFAGSRRKAWEPQALRRPSISRTRTWRWCPRERNRPTLLWNRPTHRSPRARCLDSSKHDSAAGYESERD